MFMTPLKAEQSWTTYILSTLLENWSTSRALGTAPLPALIELAHRLDISSILAAATSARRLLAPRNMSSTVFGTPRRPLGCVTDRQAAGPENFTTVSDQSVGGSNHVTSRGTGAPQCW